MNHLSIGSSKKLASPSSCALKSLTTVMCASCSLIYMYCTYKHQAHIYIQNVLAHTAHGA